MGMTGTGTGVAPFLAFAKERDWFVKNNGSERAGEMWLFFGCRNRSSDYILGHELEELAEKNVLTHLRPASPAMVPKRSTSKTRSRKKPRVYTALWLRNKA